MAALSSDDNPENMKKFRAMMGPSQVDQMLRHAISACWMILPDDKKTVDELERQLRRIFERAMRDLREDEAAFGLGK